MLDHPHARVMTTEYYDPEVIFICTRPAQLTKNLLAS
jgi:hypothetical protein